MCGRTSVALSVAFLSVFVGYFYIMLGFSTVLVYNDQNCELIAPKMAGSEDFVHLGNGLLLVGAGDLHNVFDGHKAMPGAIYVVDLASETPTASKVGIKGLPSALPFQPHGMYYSNTSRRLYVISHGVAAGSGSRIFIFAVGRRGIENIARGETWGVKDPGGLVYIRTVPSHLFQNGAINDVIEGVDANELYVTNWLQYPIPAAGKKFPKTLEEKVNLVKISLAQIFVKGTAVYRCTFVDDDSVPPQCTVAADGFYGANGITKSPDGTIFVNDVPAYRVHILSRDAVTGHLTETGRIPVQHIVDNIEWVAPGVLYMGNIPMAYRSLMKMEGYDVAVPGGLAVATYHTATKDWVVNNSVLMHDGSTLSQISVGYLYAGKVLLGSPFSNGLLLCKI